MSAPPPISVVVRTYSLGRWAELVAAINSVGSQTLQPLEIVVVVDHNTELMDQVRKSFPSVHAVENHNPKGSSGAWNSGFAAASGEIIAFMDDDAMAEPDWLARLADPYLQPNVAGVGGRILPRWQCGRPSWFPEEFDWVVGCSYRGLPQSLTPVRNLIGCNMSLRRWVFDAVGGFREGIGHVGTNPAGCDETELCIRLHQLRPESVLLYEPRAIVHHFVPEQRSTLEYFMRRCALEGRSKAVVSTLVGARDGLSSERAHTLKALPSAVARGLADSVLHLQLGGILRAAAVALGFGIAAGSYVVGRLSDAAH